MKSRLLGVVLVFVLLSSFLSFSARHASIHQTLFSTDNFRVEPQTDPQPKQDYILRLLGRGTEPLGLKENKTLNQLLGQPQVKWVIRSEQRHILN